MSKVVFNAKAMEQIREENRAAMSEQIRAMEGTMTQYRAMASSLEAEAASLDSQATTQEYIAATAMMTEEYTDADGYTHSTQVPDMSARAAAAAAAAQLRAQATAIAAAGASLESAMQESDAYMRNLIDTVQRTDITYAQAMTQAIAEMTAYTTRMQSLYESFNDTFPLTSETVNMMNKMGIQPQKSRSSLSKESTSSYVQEMLNKLLGMDERKVRESKEAFYDGLPNDLKNLVETENLIATDDGYILCTKPLAEIAKGLGYSTIGDLDANNFYDDWYVCGVTHNKFTTYSLTGMRELEHKPVYYDNVRIADTNSSAIYVPFVALDINEFRESNDYNFSSQVSGVVNASSNFKTEAVSDVLVNYFSNPSSKGSYLIAETYVDKIINVEMKNGVLSTLVGGNTDIAGAPLMNQRITDYLKINSDITYNEKESNITVNSNDEISHDVKRAILAVRTGNTSYNAFAAETKFHADRTMENQKAGQSTGFISNSFAERILESAIVSGSGIMQEDYTVNEAIYFGVFQSGNIFTDPESSIVIEQRKIHGDK